MKRIILLAVMATALVAKAQQSGNISNATVDTVSIVNTPTGVDITLKGINGETGTQVAIHRDSESRMVKLRKGRHKEADGLIDRYFTIRPDSLGQIDPWQFVIGGVGVGFNTAVGADPGLDIDMGRSLDISVLYLSGMEYRLPGTGNTVSFGLGLDWRNFRMERSAGCFHPAGGGFELGAYPEGVQPRYSQVRLFNLTVPVLYRQRLPWRPTPYGPMSVCVGPVLNFNCRTSVKTVWERPDGVEVEEYSRHLSKQPVSVDALAVLYINSSIGVYARYSPMHQMGSNAPAFSAFSTGLCIGF